MRGIFLFVLFFTGLSIRGQAPQEYLIKTYSSENGLPSNGIKGLAFDEATGFLWIGTEAGIVRFNGKDFTVFSKNNIPYLSTERIAYLLRNDKGDIYTADLYDRMFRIDVNTIKPYGMSLSNPDPHYNRNFSNSVSSSALAKRIRYPAKGLPALGIRRVLPINDSLCLLLDDLQLAYKLSLSHPVAQELKMDQIKVKEGFKIGSHIFFQTMGKALIAYNPYTEKTNTIPIEDEKGADLSDSLSNALIQWENGMEHPLMFLGKHAWLLHFEHHKIVARLICDAVPIHSFIKFSQYSKKLKTLFIGTDSKGIILIKRKQLLPMKNEQFVSQQKNAVYAQLELDNGNVLTNTGVVIGNNKSNKNIFPISGEFNVTSFVIDDSLIYFGKRNLETNFNCLHRYHKKTGVTSFYRKIQTSNAFAICKIGDKLIVSTWNGMGILKADSLEYIYKNMNSNMQVYAMVELTPNKVMLAYCDQLISVDLKTYAADTLLRSPGYCIRNIRKIKDYFFIGTYGDGYYIMHEGRIKKMPVDKKQYLLYTHCIVPDEFGYCWMSTNRGLFKAWVEDLIGAFHNNDRTVYYHYFGKNDGMDITEMNGGCAPCALEMKDKKISFPTMDGLLWVKPSEIQETFQYGKIHIDEIRTGNIIFEKESMALQQLPPSTQSLQISIGHASWCNEENIYISYRTNKSEPWIDLKEINPNIIDLNNLKAGKYQLQIRKINGYGVSNATMIEIPFTIIAPWYKKWWSILGGILLIASLIYSLLKIRARQHHVKQEKLQAQIDKKTSDLQSKNYELEKNNKINMRLISIISHDIVTPLKFLAVGSEKLVSKRKLMSEALQQETLEEITHTAIELQQLSTNIMNWIKYQSENKRLEKERFSLFDLANQVIAVLNSVANSKGLTIVHHIPFDLHIVQYMEPLKILLYNLLTNAINFSASGIISIDTQIKGNLLEISVSDEGVGMTESQITNILSDDYIISSPNLENKKGNGLGYLIIKDLLKMLHATIRIQSEKFKGTTVYLKFPK